MQGEEIAVELTVTDDLSSAEILRLAEVPERTCLFAANTFKSPTCLDLQHRK